VIDEDRNSVDCAEGHATVGYVPNAQVVIFPARGVGHACNPYWAVRVMTHELGHVLGLLHEDRACATMNATGNVSGGVECEPSPPWEWRCRLLEPDDIAGIVAAYGGRVRLATSPVLCPLYSAIDAPSRVSTSYDSTGSVMTLAFMRPTESLIPTFLAPPQTAAFAIAESTRGCPAESEAATAPRFRWTTAAGNSQRLQFPTPTHRICFAIWAIDALGRPSPYRRD
jgi:hypothetical protein